MVLKSIQYKKLKNLTKKEIKKQAVIPNSERSRAYVESYGHPREFQNPANIWMDRDLSIIHQDLREIISLLKDGKRL